MEDRYIEDGVKTRLILSGISELCEHGVRDFSLRRVAIAAQVSCAAPYRHFKDKDELILEIIRYIFSKWQLLCREIEAIYSEDAERLVTELAIANIGFWVANGNFRSVLMLETGSDVADSAKAELHQFDLPIISAIRDLAHKRGFSPERAASLEFSVPALIYGTVILVTSGKLDGMSTAVEHVRASLERELS